MDEDRVIRLSLNIRVESSSYVVRHSNTRTPTSGRDRVRCSDVVTKHHCSQIDVDTTKLGVTVGLDWKDHGPLA
jgi:hypothetical protein